MAQWKVSGADKASGVDKAVAVEAVDLKQAAAIGSAMGILIEKVDPLPPPPAIDYETPELHAARVDRAAQLNGKRRFLIRGRQPGELSTFISLLSVLLIVLGFLCVAAAWIESLDQYHHRFQTDNAYGAAANALETIAGQTAWHSFLFALMFWVLALLIRISSRLADIARSPRRL